MLRQEDLANITSTDPSLFPPLLLCSFLCIRICLVQKIGGKERDFNGGEEEGEILKSCVWLDDGRG